jgi:hypothetical protein
MSVSGRSGVRINIDSYFRLFHLLPVKGPNLKIRARISFKQKRTFVAIFT